MSAIWQILFLAGGLFLFLLVVAIYMDTSNRRDAKDWGQGEDR